MGSAWGHVKSGGCDLDGCFNINDWASFLKNDLDCPFECMLFASMVASDLCGHAWLTQG